jgi:hypothetical protein
MLGLTFRSDGSAVDAAVGALIEELNELAATASDDRDVVDRQYAKRSSIHKSRERNPGKHSRLGGAERNDTAGSLSSGLARLQSNGRARDVSGRFIARMAAAGQTAGFEVAESTQNRGPDLGGD